jgi:hypothetical protein
LADEILDQIADALICTNRTGAIIAVLRNIGRKHVDEQPSEMDDDARDAK